MNPKTTTKTDDAGRVALPDAVLPPRPVLHAWALQHRPVLCAPRRPPRLDGASLLRRLPRLDRRLIRDSEEDA